MTDIEANHRVLDEELLQEIAESGEGTVLRNTMRIYGGLFFVILLVFCYIRRHYPRVYNLRSWVDDIKTDLADDSRGFISWMWRLFTVTDTEMLEECGMDALCYCRVLEFGIKLASMGMLNALWLIPVYATAEEALETDHITDPIVSISVSHLPTGSKRFIATVVAAYVIFGYAMYNILLEFEWFTLYRNEFLSKKLSRNYAVYVQCIPSEYRTNAKLLRYFQEASAKGAVLEAHLIVQIPNLKAKFDERAALVTKLEHAINLEEKTGTILTKRNMMGQRVNVIDEYSTTLKELNKFIKKAIEDIELRHGTKFSGSMEDEESNSLEQSSESNEIEFMEVDTEQPTEDPTISSLPAYVSRPPESPSTLGSPGKKSEKQNFLSQQGSMLAKSTMGIASNVTNLAANTAGGAASFAKNLLTKEDGEPYSAGFVTFNSLRSAQAAKQMIQYPEPFAMEVLEAPQPEDVLWSNAGKNHKELQLGKLLSICLTVGLCLLWTIPMSFISTLSTIEGLKEIDVFGKLLEKAPWLEAFFAQLAPLLIVVANEGLKVILGKLSALEGPISGAVLEASLFSKLASFMIIQTFFVSLIGGSLVSQLSNMIRQPELIIDLLAQKLPARSTFFIQILMVDTFLSMGLELLRVVPVVVAALRSRFGPNLTQKERDTTWMGLAPLCEPDSFQHANLLAGTVLYFMVYFVYAVIAPISCFFMGICFLLMGAGYRHQFVYIYPTFPDSGGKLWTSFFSIIPSCMIIAQVTIVGMLGLKQTVIASLMMFPLLVVTILFTIYINQQHFRITQFLSSRDCIAVDLKNNADGKMNCDFLKGKYFQPELCEKEVFPNISSEDLE